MYRRLFAPLTTLTLLSALGCGGASVDTPAEATTTIRVTLENVSDDQTHTLSDGSSLTIALAQTLIINLFDRARPRRITSMLWRATWFQNHA